MKNPLLRKTLIFSLLGHLTLFSIFSLSFGNKIPSLDYSPVNFWGSVGRMEFNNSSRIMSRGVKESFVKAQDSLRFDSATFSMKLSDSYYLKPTSVVLLHDGKPAIIQKLLASPYSFKRREPLIILHPLLPYDFTLYFKDRQVAHVELMFNLVSNGERTSAVIKRKISSGNLEVDLLSMRYIGHYLFIQQSRFTPDRWQSVKIDLSAKND
jgi:hypothetical protein